MPCRILRLTPSLDDKLLCVKAPSQGWSSFYKKTKRYFSSLLVYILVTIWDWTEMMAGRWAKVDPKSKKWHLVYIITAIIQKKNYAPTNHIRISSRVKFNNIHQVAEDLGVPEHIRSICWIKRVSFSREKIRNIKKYRVVVSGWWRDQIKNL